MKNFRYTALTACLSGIAVFSCAEKETEKNPNILLILVDDMGYSDLSSFGGEIPTPNIDMLSEQGVNFTQFYNTARSSPSRASLLTGLYPHEAGVGHLAHQYDGPGYLGFLNDSCVTIAEVLNERGYLTAMTGKWHLGTVRHSWPSERGFQEVWGIHNWVDSYFKVLENCDVFKNGELIIPATETPQRGAREGEEWYTTDVFTTKALKQIDKALDEDRPFFSYLAHNVPHWPLEAHDDVIEKYLDKYSDGYEVLRVERFERMKDLGIIPEAWKLPEQITPEWDMLCDSVKEDTQFRRAIYAAQIDILDQNIGRMIRHLKERDAFDNTIIFFMSDNGCSAEPEEDWGNKDWGHFGYQWGVNTRWNYEEWRTNSGRSSSVGKVWAITSNSPLRFYKKYAHEGGIATPLIVHWPDGIKNPGSIDRRPGHLIDVMATVLDLTESEYPDEVNGVPIIPLRGISFYENLRGREGKEHDFIFWEHEGQGALRMGKWKVVTENIDDLNSWELYNMEKDGTETNDIADQHPEKVEKMLAKWTTMAYETKALPKPDGSLSRPNPIDY